MSFVDGILEAARSQVGVAEATGRNDGPPSERYCGGRMEPWCAHFVAWCYRKAGCPLPGDVEPSLKRPNPCALVATLRNQLAGANQLCDGPTVGGLVLFETRMGSDPATSSVSHHVGLVDCIDVAAGMVWLIEGNAGNKVQRIRYTRRRLKARAWCYSAPPSG